MVSGMGKARMCPTSSWRPAADVYRNERDWVVKFDLAGVRLEDLQLSIGGRCLVVCGQRRDVFAGPGMEPYSMEIAYHRFERRVELPIELEDTILTTEYHDGMLIVYLRARSALDT